METVWNHNKDIVRDTVPDIVVFLDVNLEIALRRSGRDNPDKFDRENASFCSDVYRGYEETVVWMQESFRDTQVIRIEDKFGCLTPGETFGLLLHGIWPHIKCWIETRNRLVVREVAR